MERCEGWSEGMEDMRDGRCKGWSEGMEGVRDGVRDGRWSEGWKGMRMEECEGWRGVRGEHKGLFM